MGRLILLVAGVAALGALLLGARAPSSGGLRGTTALVEGAAAPGVPVIAATGEAYLIGVPMPTPRPAGDAACPVAPASGTVVMTQGYGVGSHAPAETWGGIDLAIDGDGDGVAEPDASWGAPVIALHAGRARVVPNSWPGGNWVEIAHPDGVTVTKYGHLAEILVASGADVQAGQQIGTVGSTGQSSGPHLHLEYWLRGVNTKPEQIVRC